MQTPQHLCSNLQQWCAHCEVSATRICQEKKENRGNSTCKARAVQKTRHCEQPADEHTGLQHHMGGGAAAEGAAHPGCSFASPKRTEGLVGGEQHRAHSTQLTEEPRTRRVLEEGPLQTGFSWKGRGHGPAEKPGGFQGFEAKAL